MSLFHIDSDNCNRCNICVLECPCRIIELKKQDVVPVPTSNAAENCIHCGHCVAVCPHDAFAHADMSPGDCPPVQSEWMMEPDRMAQFLKARRSIRSYKKKAVDPELINRLIDIARFAPTGSNMQSPRWTVVSGTEKVREMSGMVIDYMRHIKIDNPSLAKEWGYEDLVHAWDNGRDPICLDAPHVIIAHASKEMATPVEDCSIALTFLDLAAVSHGLGTCWAGFLYFSINEWPPLREMIGLPDGHNALGAMMLGYAKFKYHRIPLRNDASISWIA
jgi:nitroreductase/NAD-dependent dihydropyrimidine dehydrogenase PreA subunit